MGFIDSPNPLLTAYERGSFGVILTAAKATNAQVGTAPPPNSMVFAISPAVTNDQDTATFTFQLDVVGAPAAVVTAYGSADGNNYYSLGALQASGTYGLFFLVDKKVRYITAAVTAYAGNGTTDTISIGFTA